MILKVHLVLTRAGCLSLCNNVRSFVFVEWILRTERERESPLGQTPLRKTVSVDGALMLRLVLQIGGIIQKSCGHFGGEAPKRHQHGVIKCHPIIKIIIM